MSDNPLTAADITKLLAQPSKRRKKKTGSFVIYADGTKEYRKVTKFDAGEYTTPKRSTNRGWMGGKRKQSPKFIAGSPDIVAYMVVRP